MAQETLKVIAVKCFTVIGEEGLANAGITPGHIVELMSTGKFKVHATAGGNVVPLKVAIEDELQGKGIDDDYATGKLVQVRTLRAGDWFNAILADGQNIAIGDRIESAGDGTVQKHTADTVSASSAEAVSATIYSNQIIGIAREALDLSGSSGEESSGISTNPRILVEAV